MYVCIQYIYVGKMTIVSPVQRYLGNRCFLICSALQIQLRRYEKYPSCHV